MRFCTAYWTLYACSLAAGALVCLAVANRILMALDDAHSAAREALEKRCRTALRDETAWLIRDAAGKGLIFERDGAEWEYSVN